MGDLNVGAVVAGLRVEALAGRGGMGVVYRAFDPTLHRTVALKVIGEGFAADPEFRERFRQEARSAAGIEHPGVVTVHWAGEDAGQLFLVMQYVEGTDLRALVTERGRIDPVLTVDLVSQVAAALDAAHARGLVHRDVKPANVLVADVGLEQRAYLTDFGLARPVDASRQITGTGLVVGTEAYMAPELFLGGSASVRSDVYALGCVLFHCLAGRVFPRGGGQTSLVDSVGDPDLAAALDAVMLKALAVDPEHRFAGAGELAAAARTALYEAQHGGTRAGAVAAAAPVQAGSARVQLGPPTTAPPSALPEEAPPGSAPSGPTPPPRPVGPLYRPVPSATAAPASAASTEAPGNPVAWSPAAWNPAPLGPAPNRRAPGQAGPGYRPPGYGSALGPTFIDPRPQAPGSVHPSVPSWPGTAPPPTVSGPALDSGSRPRRRGRVAVMVALAAATGVVAVLLVPRLMASSGTSGGDASAGSVVLSSVTDEGSTLRLVWSGPPGLDYGVDVAEEGRSGSTQLVGRTTTATVPVTPGIGYCVQVRGTDGSTVSSSATEAVRGASCNES